jgi:hypothetical protein
MRFYGKVYKDGKFWLAELPLFDAMTQGHTRKEAYAMVEDLLESLANRPGFKVTVHPGKKGDFGISSNDPRGLISLLFRRQCEKSGLSFECQEEIPFGICAPCHTAITQMTSASIL